MHQKHDCGPTLRRQKAAEERYKEMEEGRKRREREDRKRRRRYATAAGVVALIVAGVAVANIGGDEDSSAEERLAGSSAATTSSYRPPTREVSSGPAIDSDLAAHGMTRALLDELNAEAARNGYSITPGVLLPESILEVFAGGMISVCEDVRLGYSNWERETQRDISDGAPRASAERMNNYLKNEFCPFVG